MFSQQIGMGPLTLRRSAPQGQEISIWANTQIPTIPNTMNMTY